MALARSCPGPGAVALPSPGVPGRVLLILAEPIRRIKPADPAGGSGGPGGQGNSYSILRRKVNNTREVRRSSGREWTDGWRDPRAVWARGLGEDRPAAGPVP